MTTYYVFRHGDILNPNQVLYLHLDQEIKLSSSGQKQVATQAKKLKNKQIKAIYYSPLWRTRQSAQIIETIFHTGNLISEPKLIEVNNPQQGVSLKQFDRQWGGNLYHPDLITQGGETMQQIADRMLLVVQEINQQYPHQAVALVSHGDPIKILWLIADKQELTTQNLGSDRYPIPGVQYPRKGSVSVFQYQDHQFTRTDYWSPPKTEN